MVHWKIARCRSHSFCELLTVAFIFALGATMAGGQAITTPTARARWIAPAGAPANGPGVYSFRKVFSLSTVPKHYLVHVSADNRFLLYVNGQRIGDGPARGDLGHWRYETFDLASALHKGSNIVAARVWNFDPLSPIAQISLRTGFLLWPEESSGPAIDTNANWQARVEQGWTENPNGFPANEYHGIGPGEILDGALYDWDWNKLPAKESTQSWSAAVELPQQPQIATPANGSANNWALVPDQLPHMSYTEESAGHVVRSSLAELTPTRTTFLEKPLTIPAHTHAVILLDRDTLTTAYPEIAVSGGKGAHVRLTYAEALYSGTDPNGKRQKGNRNDIQGKHMDMQMLHDEFQPDGGLLRTFSPLWWRTWRYLQIDVETNDDPIQLDAMRAYDTGYPWQERATFQSSEPDLSKIWDVGWRTIQVDTHETYMDCAYWEQLQYVGDTRIEALITYTATGDDRLARQALHAIADSRMANGLTQSRSPSTQNQVIPPFSLLWVGMLHDYWWYRPDTSLVTELLPVSRTILAWFIHQQRADGLLGKLPSNGYDSWNFIDWAPTFKSGVPPEDPDGGSVPVTLQFAAALRDAADLEAAVGDPALATKYRANADRIVAAVYREAWDSSRGLLADTPAKKAFSQQANILGVMLDVIPKDKQKQVLQTILADELAGKPIYPKSPEIIPASYYFRFYLARAVDHAGMGDLYLHLLGPWRNMLQLGLSTWAETPEPTRSDAHAWSSHPNYDLLTIVAGIRPAAPGFRSVQIAPHLAGLNSLDATMPHPKGTIAVSYRRTGDHIHAHVALPAGVTGTFVWGSKDIPLHSGAQDLKLDVDDSMTR